MCIKIIRNTRHGIEGLKSTNQRESKANILERPRGLKYDQDIIEGAI